MIVGRVYLLLSFVFGVEISQIGAWSLSSPPSGWRPLDSLATSARQRLAGLGKLWQPSSRSNDKPLLYANSQDESSPWKFTGRCIFVPALVRCDATSLPNSDLVLMSLGGWTIGGTVVLEYDSSPVGYYREWVTLGGLAVYPRLTLENQSFLVGQFGSNLYVSEPQAKTLCERVWGLQAKGADIQLLGESEAGSSSCIALETDESASGNSLVLKASGWENTKKSLGLLFKNIGLLWTPTIKAIWACLVKLPAAKHSASREGDGIYPSGVLPLNSLRLSGRVRLAKFETLSLPKEQPSTIPLGIGLSVEKLIIEISSSILDP